MHAYGGGDIDGEADVLAAGGTGPIVYTWLDPFFNVVGGGTNVTGLSTMASSVLVMWLRLVFNVNCSSPPMLSSKVYFVNKSAFISRWISFFGPVSL